jgi:hypothetical protein
MKPENNNADNSRFSLYGASFSLRMEIEKPGQLKEIRSRAGGIPSESETGAAFDRSGDLSLPGNASTG